MKTKFLGLRTTIYKVSEIEEATKWYSNAFETEPYFKESFYVGFNIAGYELGLVPDNQQIEEKPASVMTYWGVENVGKIYEQLLEYGATVYEKPHNVGGEIEVGAVKDPWGNILGIIYNPEFKLN